MGAIRGVRIGMPERTRRGGAWRVSAEVDGVEAWFESPDLPLVPSAEAFAGAFLLPAQTAGAELVVDSPLCPVWRRNAVRLAEVYSRWWGLRRITVSAPEGEPSDQEPAPKTALCFSMGLDSFFSLLRGPRRPDFLVFLHGFDLLLDETEPARRGFHAVSEVADQFGICPVLIRTNLREHPLFNRAYWGNVFGAALAAAGHVLPGVGTLLVSSCFTDTQNEPWGSHALTEPLRSSGRTEVVRVGGDHNRLDKLRALCDEPLVQRHLTVCWSPWKQETNCGQCEKCLRTMLLLMGLGKLDRFRLFPPPESLPERLDQITLMRTNIIPGYQALLEAGIPDGRCQAAVRRLVKRSRRHHGRMRCWGRTVERRARMAMPVGLRRWLRAARQKVSI